MLQPLLRELDIRILICLAEQPAYGYELFKQESLQSLHIRHQSSLYYSLHKLHSLEFTKIQHKKGSKNPNQQIYSLTSKGKKQLFRELHKTHRYYQKELTVLWNNQRNVYSLQQRLLTTMHQLASDTLSRKPL